jgi:hypothetical protein
MNSLSSELLSKPGTNVRIPEGLTPEDYVTLEAMKRKTIEDSWGRYLRSVYEHDEDGRVLDVKPQVASSFGVDFI